MTKAKPAGAMKRKRSPPKPREMPKFTKPPASPVDAFQGAVAELPDAQARQMFGDPAAFTKTQMFASLFQDKMIVRLSDGDREALGRDGAQPFQPLPGRPMREYVVVPAAVRESPSALRSWLGKAHAASLPPKRKKQPSASAGR